MKLLLNSRPSPRWTPRPVNARLAATMSDEIQSPLPADPIGYTPALEKTEDLRSISVLPPMLKVDEGTKQAVRWMFKDSKHVPLALVCGMPDVDVSDTRQEAESGLRNFLADLKERRGVEPEAVLASVQPATVAEALAYIGGGGLVTSDALASRLQLLLRNQLAVETRIEHCTRWMMEDVVRARLVLQDPRDATKVLKKAASVFQQRHGHSGVSRR